MKSKKSSRTLFLSYLFAATSNRSVVISSTSCMPHVSNTFFIVVPSFKTTKSASSTAFVLMNVNNSSRVKAEAACKWMSTLVICSKSALSFFVSINSYVSLIMQYRVNKSYVKIKSSKYVCITLTKFA